MSTIKNDETFLSEGMLKLLRRQRHNFLNDLQIIYSLIQLEKTEEAINYIEKISKDNNWIAGITAEHNKSAL